MKGAGIGLDDPASLGEILEGLNIDELAVEELEKLGMGEVDVVDQELMHNIRSVMPASVEQLGERDLIKIMQAIGECLSEIDRVIAMKKGSKDVKEMLLKQIRAKLMEMNRDLPVEQKKNKVETDRRIVSTEHGIALLDYVIRYLEAVQSKLSKDFQTCSRAITAIQQESYKSGRLDNSVGRSTARQFQQRKT